MTIPPPTGTRPPQGPNDEIPTPATRTTRSSTAHHPGRIARRRVDRHGPIRFHFRAGLSLTGPPSRQVNPRPGEADEPPPAQRRPARGAWSEHACRRRHCGPPRVRQLPPRQLPKDSNRAGAPALANPAARPVDQQPRHPNRARQPAPSHPLRPPLRPAIAPIPPTKAHRPAPWQAPPRPVGQHSRNPPPSRRDPPGPLLTGHPPSTPRHLTRPPQKSRPPRSWPGLATAPAGTLPRSA